MKKWRFDRSPDLDKNFKGTFFFLLLELEAYLYNLIKGESPLTKADKCIKQYVTGLCPSTLKIIFWGYCLQLDFEDIQFHKNIFAKFKVSLKFCKQYRKIQKAV